MVAERQCEIAAIGSLFFAAVFIIYPIVVLNHHDRASVKAVFTGVLEDDMDLSNDFDECRERGSGGDDRIKGSGDGRFQS